MCEMNKTGRNIFKRVILIFLTAVLALLTLASCVYSLCRIPVFLTYEEAVENVRVEDGIMYVTRTDRVTGGMTFNDQHIFTSYRCRWWYNTQPESKHDRKVAQYTVLYYDQWYLGYLANDEDVLMYDIEDKDRFVDEYLVTSRILEYLCYATLAIGVVLGGTGFMLRQKGAGKVMLSVALFLLLFGVSCLYVTGGRMRYIYSTFGGSLEFKVGYYMFLFGIKYVMIFLTALFSWGTCMSAVGLAKEFRKN